MRMKLERILMTAVLGVGLGSVPLYPAGAASIGSVMSTTGAAHIVAADGTTRGIGCGAQLSSGERVVTEDGARVGMVVGDVYVQLEGATRVTATLDAAGALSLEAASGRLRVVDTRSAGGPALELTTPHARARGVGTDTEVFVSGLETVLCEGGARLDVVTRPAGDASAAQPGECVALRADAPPTLAAKPSAEQIVVAGSQGCFALRVASHFAPDVAAAPGIIGIAPIDPGRRLEGPCSGLGGDCFAIAAPTSVIIEQPPEPPVCGFGVPCTP